LAVLFKKTSVKESDFVNDNIEVYENDVKNYDKLRRTAKEDVIKFDQPSLYSVETQLLLAPLPDGGKKVKKFLMPSIRTYLPTEAENPLKKSRAFSFEQLYAFNNLCMNKSFLRKRVRSLEVDVSTA
jgi:hypothetical protein